MALRIRKDAGLAALEKASGRDLSDWGRQWLKTTGLNTLRADFDVDGDGRDDLVVTAQNSHHVNWWLARGPADALTLERQVDLGAHSGPLDVVLADLDLSLAEDKRMPDGTDLFAARRPALYREVAQPPVSAAPAPAAAARPRVAAPAWAEAARPRCG